MRHDGYLNNGLLCRESLIESEQNLSNHFAETATQRPESYQLNGSNVNRTVLDTFVSVTPSPR